MEKEYIITYQTYEMFSGKLLDNIKTYQCKDGNDYQRCVNLFHEGKIKLLSVNDRKIN